VTDEAMPPAVVNPVIKKLSLLSQHLPGGIKENPKNSVSQPRLKPETT
jgi:hypothetical protein